MARKTIFVYEFLTGGGLLHGAAATSSINSPFAEGRLMADAIAADFAHATNCDVVGMRDLRMCRGDSSGSIAWHHVLTAAEERQTFCLLASQADWTLVIAPEFDGLLANRYRMAQQAGGKLLNASLLCLELAADKQRTCEHLSGCGVPVPRGIALHAGTLRQQLPPDFAFWPAVLKDRYGAGSQHVQRLETSADLPDTMPCDCRLEEYCPGVPVSVALLCGPAQRLALMPCRQSLSDDGRFRYQGGCLPLDDERAARAEQLAMRAVDCLPDPRGWMGVDLVLGDSAAADRVIEINPRCTTSYIGLRQAYRGNLAAAMLTLAAGGTIDPQSLQPRKLQAGEIAWSVSSTAAHDAA